MFVYLKFTRYWFVYLKFTRYMFVYLKITRYMFVYLKFTRYMFVYLKFTRYMFVSITHGYVWIHHVVCGRGMTELAVRLTMYCVLSTLAITNMLT